DLMAVTDELAAADDRVIRFRLSRPFPMLPIALGKTTTPMCAMMPERLARTDPFREVPEMVGSGPFRFLTDERVSGARSAYARFERYRPRPDGTTDWTAGPKHAHFDRIEWNTLPDIGTAAAALRAGEQDWLAYVSPDLAPTLRRARNLRVARLDQTGMMNILQLNHLQPPFDNPAIRRALLGAIDQAACMQAIVGDDPAAYHTPLGFFCPGTPMANEQGLEAFTAPRDMGAVQSALRAAGYGGERVVLMIPVDNPPLQALGEVAADTLKRAGLNLDVQAMDYGTMLARRQRTESVVEGGWSAFVTGTAGTDWLNPAWHVMIRGSGRSGYPGWSSSERREALRRSWLDATEDGERRRLCAALQRQCLEEVPCTPLGQYFQAVAYRTSLTGMLNGFPTFWGVRPA
ncbi:MAG TPA: ABC transporter substrate-binding protein, partial [Roseomonas sp.]